MALTRKIHRGGMKTKVKKGKGHCTKGGKSMKTKVKKGKGHCTKGGKSMKTKVKKGKGHCTKGGKSMKTKVKKGGQLPGDVAPAGEDKTRFSVNNDKEEIPPDLQRLILAGKQPEDAPAGQVNPVDMVKLRDSNDNDNDKAEIQEEEEIPPGPQRLIFGGKQLL